MSITKLLIRAIHPPVGIFLETGKKKNTLKAGGEGLINKIQAVKLKYSGWLGDGWQKRSSSRESLYLLPDSATGDSEMAANQGHRLPLGGDACYYILAQKYKLELQHSQTGRVRQAKSMGESKRLSTHILLYLEVKGTREYPV